MSLEKLQKDRFLRKDSNQTDQTKSAIYTASNPAPKRGDDMLRKIGRPKGSEEDDGAPNILTGTVIVSCFIQTSALPSRIEMQGNDLTFFDDTYSRGGSVIGDTSRLIFTYGSAKHGELIDHGYIMEKRASVFNTYDNVLSWFALPAEEGAHNYMFIGRDAYSETQQRNLHSIHFAVEKDSNFTPEDNLALNGVFDVEYSVDGVYQGRVFMGGNSELLLPGSGLTGWSSLILGGDGGAVGIGYTVGASISVAMYMVNATAVMLGADLIPDAPNAYDIGSASSPIRTIYANSVQNTGVTIGSVQRITGPGAINVTTTTTAITTTGLAQAFTLADGSDGQIKYICIEVDGGSAEITPTTGNGFTTMTLNGLGDGATLIFLTGAGWTCVGENSATFA